MPSANQRVVDLAVSHEVELQRAFSRITADTLARFGQGDRVLLRRVREAVGRGDPPAAILSLVLASLAARFGQEFRVLVSGELAAVALMEVGFDRRALRQADPRFERVSAPSPLVVGGAVSGMLVGGRTLEQWIGLARGRAVRDLADSAGRAGTVTADAVRGVIARLNRDVASTIRTFLQATAERARELFYAANSDEEPPRGPQPPALDPQSYPPRIRQVEVIAVLDNRTSSTCQRMHLRRFPVGQGPRPPFHFNCRSRIRPVIPGGGQAKIPTFTEWIRGQPDDVKEELLGKARAKWLREHPQQTVSRAWLLEIVNQPGIPVREIRFRQLLATEGVAA